jgi:hypothetical protein
VKIMNEKRNDTIIECKKCGELNYLIPYTFWNIMDFGVKCEKFETINTMTLEYGELKKIGLDIR